MRRLTRFLLIGFCSSAAIAVLLVSAFPRFVGTLAFASVNLGTTVAALDALRRTDWSLARGGSLKTAGLVGGIVALISVSGLVAPHWIAEIQSEAHLSVQILVLSTGYAAAALAWLTDAWNRRPESSKVS